MLTCVIIQHKRPTRARDPEIETGRFGESLDHANFHLFELEQKTELTQTSIVWKLKYSIFYESQTLVFLSVRFYITDNAKDYTESLYDCCFIESPVRKESLINYARVREKNGPYYLGKYQSKISNCVTSHFFLDNLNGQVEN